MLIFLQSLFAGKVEREHSSDQSSGNEAPPDSVRVDGAEPFLLASHISKVNSLPYAEWDAMESWVESLPSQQMQAQAWLMCERVWLLHMRTALGSGYHLQEMDHAFLLSPLEPNVARATLEFMDRTLRRISYVLEGVAHVPEWGKDILIVFDDYKAYYNYVSHYYPEEGEFAGSSGMYINRGCGHFVTVKSDLRAIEPVIAHEMTHGCVAHLPLPAWLNEGIAVNTERRLTGIGSPLYTPQEMHEKHLEFWGPIEAQEFWSGKSFLRGDEGNMLSYDLARIVVEHMAKDWGSFKSFVLAADRADAGSVERGGFRAHDNPHYS